MTLSKHARPTGLAVKFIACGFAAMCLLTSHAHAAEFMAGADISALTVHEDHGATYRDNGVLGDPVDILADHGVNWFRLRLFVDPSNLGDDFVVNDLAYTIDLAKRAKAAGAKLLLDFHYSDTWADPGKQFKPAAWTSLNYTQLQQKIYDYTKASIEAFKAEDVLPEMVQIGNEISNGMLWNSPGPGGSNTGYPWTGGSHNTGFDRLAGLLQSGIDGAKDGAGIGQEPLIMIHHDKGADWGATQFYFDKLVARDLDFDVIGYSYYPKFHYNPANGAGDVADVATNLNNTANKYDKPVVIVEAGFPSRGAQFEPDYEFDVSTAGQQAYLQSLVDAVKNVPNDLGWGVFWWYAEARPTSGLSVWEGGRYSLFDQNGNLLPAASVFENVNIPGDYNFDGLVDGGDLEVWSSLYGQTGHALDADGNRDGMVDGRDFLFWQQHFGAGAPASVVSVPEPSTFALFGALVIALAIKRHPSKWSSFYMRFATWLAPFWCRINRFTLPLAPFMNVIFASTTLQKNFLGDSGKNSSFPCPVACKISCPSSTVTVITNSGVIA